MEDKDFMMTLTFSLEEFGEKTVLTKTVPTGNWCQYSNQLEIINAIYKDFLKTCTFAVDDDSEVMLLNGDEVAVVDDYRMCLDDYK